ncbi:MAG: hypothetical protein KAS32_10585 [Candidatus Peribacteraceae bacterium]|nr:hypothetical protein [Candidatus Peribacteraceae bacterium]
MKEKLLEYLPDPNTVKGGIAEVVEIVQTEAPLVVEEIIRWHIAYNLVWFVGSAVVFALVLFVLTKWTWKFGIKEYNKGEEGYFVAGVILPILLMIVCIFVFGSHFGWMKPLMAPRLFLLEYLSNIIK